MKDKITEAVLALNGVLPQQGIPCLDSVVYYIGVWSGDIFSVNDNGLESDFICTQSEFLQRAKALGFIEQTGYRYGVEYETNRKKPELPDDVLVAFKNELTGEWYQYYDDEAHCNQVDCWLWDRSKAFRIVDKRYKPTEATPEVMPVAAKPITDFDDCSIEFETPELDHFDVADALLEQIAVLMKLGEDDLVGVLQGVNAKLIAKGEAKALRERVVGAVYEYGLSQGYDQCRKELEDYYDKGFLKIPEGDDNV